MDNIDEVIDLKPPTDAAFNNKSISLESVKPEINISEEYINGSSDNKFEFSKEAGKKVCQCTICGFQTLYKSNLHQHKKTHLAREERQLLPCGHCGKKYARKQTLEHHLEENHTDSRAKELIKSQKKVYRCSSCSYQTQNTSGLSHHKKVHLPPEERQLFACAHCEKKYTLKTNLRRHFQDTHTDSRTKKVKKPPKKVYKCTICDYQTPYSSTIRRHKNVHLVEEERQMFDYAQCDTKYRPKNGLQYSRMKELEESQKKVYRCTICNYQTLHRPNLYKHKKVHLALEERQIFACAQCDKKYMSNRRLQDHIKRNHIDSRNPDISAEVILDSLKMEIDDHALLLDEFTNDECPAVTNEVKSEGFIKTEPDYIALSLNKDMHDDFKNSECLSETYEVKSDFIKMELVDVAPFLNKHIYDSFKNTENLSVTKKVKLENFIKMESDNDVPLDEENIIL
ncbi:PR domain zinc finger protein 5-like [Sitophilus oryzae]|uniref:PR domain zinc finger protein 5-like n=1 Tax=Sitophilus oryzae TaxID=7048 RepID=A0A6J2XQI3_SITOR|nr:PR domain zinc finger protein 5-like [Sitophilus oryzae]